MSSTYLSKSARESPWKSGKKRQHSRLCSINICRTNVRLMTATVKRATTRVRRLRGGLRNSKAGIRLVAWSMSSLALNPPTSHARAWAAPTTQKLATKSSTNSSNTAMSQAPTAPTLPKEGRHHCASHTHSSRSQNSSKVCPPAIISTPRPSHVPATSSSHSPCPSSTNRLFQGKRCSPRHSPMPTSSRSTYTHRIRIT